MKKILAAVLAVALVAVGVVVGTKIAPAPVADPADDGVVTVAADATEPVAEDKAPAEDVKTAVLGDVVSEGGDDESNEGDGEDAPVTAPAAEDEVKAKSDLAPGDSVSLDSDGDYTGSVSITFSNSNDSVTHGYNNDYENDDSSGSVSDYEETFKDVFGEDAYNEVFGDAE